MSIDQLLDEAAIQKKRPPKIQTKSPAPKMIPRVAPIPEEPRLTCIFVKLLKPPIYLVS